MHRRRRTARGIATVLALSCVIALGGCRPSVTAPVMASEEIRGPWPDEASLEIRYVANEGVLLSARDKRVLIDGLHREYGPEYAFLPDGERQKMEGARSPFERVDLLLVSHMHGDHFHPESVGLYLENSPKTILATSQQVVAELEAKYKKHESIRSRVMPLQWTAGESAEKEISGIEVQFLALSHGTGRHASIQNLGHVFTLGGKKLLHVGDAENFAKFRLGEQNIDIAFLPIWYLTSESGRALIRDHIKPKHIIAVHVSPASAKTDAIEARKHFPDADVFTTMLEKRYF